MPFEHEAVRKLIDFKEEIEKLIEPLEKNTSDGREFRTNFKKLKERMQAEYKWSSIVRAQKNMDYIERDFYWPAIQGAWVAISFAKISGNPSSWLHPLYDAQFELNWHLSQLDK